MNRVSYSDTAFYPPRETVFSTIASAHLQRTLERSRRAVKSLHSPLAPLAQQRHYRFRSLGDHIAKRSGLFSIERLQHVVNRIDSLRRPPNADPDTIKRSPCQLLHDGNHATMASGTAFEPNADATEW